MINQAADERLLQKLPNSLGGCCLCYRYLEPLALLQHLLLDMEGWREKEDLITGATGQVGSRTINGLLGEKEVEVVAAVRSPAKEADFNNKGIATVILDLDDERTHLPALQGIDSLFVLTGYTVDMLRQSKALLDNASKAGVRHVVHLGACGRDDTTVAHWAWHQFVERYIEWAGFFLHAPAPGNLHAEPAELWG